jgi:hypothetical protein
MCKNFSTRKEAKQHIIKINIECNLPIVTIIIDKGSHLECEIDDNNTMLFDRSDLELIQEHTIYMSGGYPGTWIDSIHVKFHNVIMNHKPGKINWITEEPI